MTSAEPDDSPAPMDAPLPQPLPSPLPRPLFVPRGLVMLSALWVFSSWILLFGLKPPVQPQAASYGPTLEILFASIGVGIAIGWPLLRLSARPSSAPLMQSIFDGFAIVVLLQVVVWPLRLVSSWSLARTWLVIAAITVAVLLAGAVLALTQASARPRVRTRAMIALVTAAMLPIAIGVVGEAISPTGSPVFSPAASSGNGESWRVLLEASVPTSAPTLLWRSASAIPLDPSTAEWSHIRHGALLAAVLWTVAFVIRARERLRGHRPERPDPLS